MCGGTAAPGHGACGGGLSPRVRGNPRAKASTPTAAGSIPACAGEPRRRGWNAAAEAVYPRVCGGTDEQTGGHRGRRGLSPRVRGNLARTGGRAQDDGSIPACAGEPPCHSRLTMAWPVYPRVCGGTSRRRATMTAQLGLSPRVRGNRPQSAHAHRPRRSIPACAGEPAGRRPPTILARVYPRVCGGTRSRRGRLPVFRGLSPRVRGNLLAGVSPPHGTRSIPACAGEPWRGWTRRSRRRVYPRVCGGTAWLGVGLLRGEGLSPRVRENRSTISTSTCGGGSIPACAGEPGAPPCSASRRGGLSPRVRGNLLKAIPAERLPRSIPACAGEPYSLDFYGCSYRVYPRVSGGTMLRRPGSIPACAGEPRVASVGRTAPIRRSIPACAGEPTGDSARCLLGPHARSIPACAGEPGLRLPCMCLARRGVYPRVCGGTY